MFEVRFLQKKMKMKMKEAKQRKYYQLVGYLRIASPKKGVVRRNLAIARSVLDYSLELMFTGVNMFLARLKLI